ncbi:MAG: hypothetical protein AAF662_04370 [Pseudomonadota bacterium]
MPSRRPTKPTSVMITERDLDVFSHIARYGLTVAEAVARLPGFTTASLAAATNRLNALTRAGFLRRGRLYAGRSYYQLSLKSAKLVGARPETARPISTQVKIRDFGILLFCSLGDIEYRKLTPGEFREGFPQLHRQGQKISYYIAERDGKVRLGLIRVDHGGSGAWDRLIDKCRQDVRSRCDQPGYRAFVDEDAFEITVVTAVEHKADRILQAVRENPVPVPLHVFVAPDLFPLIAAGASPPQTRRGNAG